MTPARTSKLAGTVFWPDGTTRFNGHVDIVLMVPGIDGRTQLWPRLSIGQGYPSVEIPQWTRVKITDGVFDQGVALWYNSDIIPHNTKYVAHYYDSSMTSVGRPSTVFEVSAASTVPPVEITKSPVAATDADSSPAPAEVI